MIAAGSPTKWNCSTSRDSSRAFVGVSVERPNLGSFAAAKPYPARTNGPYFLGTLFPALVLLYVGRALICPCAAGPWAANLNSVFDTATARGTALLAVEQLAGAARLPAPAAPVKSMVFAVRVLGPAPARGSADAWGRSFPDDHE